MTTLPQNSGSGDAVVRFAFGESSLGFVLVARTEKGVCGISLGDDRAALVRELQDRFPGVRVTGGAAELHDLAAEVAAFVDTPANELDLPLDLHGTEFQRRVWEALRNIPLGQTASYTEIAERIGSPGSVRAVARACADNIVALAVPCHRVIGKDGALTGYRWGVERKRALLEREAAA